MNHPMPARLLEVSCCLLCVLAFACDEDDDSGPIPVDAGAASQADDEDGPFGDGDDSEDDPSPEPEPDDEPGPALPPPVPADPPVTTSCGELECRDVLVGDVVVPPCCPVGDEPRCGLELDEVSSFMPIQGGCFALEQPGNRDTSCPDVFFNDPIELRDLPGCCMPEGTCGVVANFALLADFGCIDPRTLLLGVPDDELETCTPEIPEPEPEPTDEPDRDSGSEPPVLDGGSPDEPEPGIDAGDGGGGEPEEPTPILDASSEPSMDGAVSADGG